MTSVRAGKVGPVAGVAGAGRAGGSGGTTHRALKSIAANVAGRIAAELDLVDPDGRRKPLTATHDLYGLDEIAARLAQELSCTPAEAGEIARALHAFAAEVAARIGAARDSRSVEDIAALFAGRMTEVHDAAEAIALIRRATADVAR